MALIEINLEKPALVEERAASRSASERGRTDSPHRSGSDSFDRSGDGDSSGGGKLKLLGLLAAVVAVGAVVAKLKGRGSDDGDQSRAYDHGPEPEIGGDESGGRMRKVAGLLGLVGAIARVLAIARKGRT